LRAAHVEGVTEQVPRLNTNFLGMPTGAGCGARVVLGLCGGCVAVCLEGPQCDARGRTFDALTYLKMRPQANRKRAIPMAACFPELPSAF
jgi:hypothetical protein